MRATAAAPRTVALGLALAALTLAAPSRAQMPPLHDRVVVVVLENKSFTQASLQPYMTSLAASGALFTNSRGVARPSQPNYFALWAGNTLGISTNDCPVPGSPFPYENLGHACEANGLSWRAYSENLPSPGSAVCSADGNPSSGLYTRKHAPWTYFSNLDHMSERPYSEFAAVLAAHALPNLAFVVPNNCHNSHNDATPGCTIADADVWLAANVPPILAELGPNGLLVFTWDEDDGTESNRIFTALVGPHVIPGSIYAPLANHYAMSRLLCDVLGLPPMGFGVLEEPILGIWTATVPALDSTWGGLKTIYR